VTVEFFGGRKLPVARDEGLLVEQVADETVVYDSKTKAAHCLSPLASIVFARCDGRTTVEELAAVATERLGEPVDPPLVVDALAQLEERELLAVTPRLEVSPDGRLSRRQMIGKSAAAGGALVGASLITTIVAPTPAAAQTQMCDPASLCRCCEKDACAANDPPGGLCDQGGQNCCLGQACNCTKVTGEGFAHCKPANAATACDCVSNSCLCTPTVC
jgi:hypothetical protein